MRKSQAFNRCLKDNGERMLTTACNVFMWGGALHAIYLMAVPTPLRPVVARRNAQLALVSSAGAHLASCVAFLPATSTRRVGVIYSLLGERANRISHVPCVCGSLSPPPPQPTYPPPNTRTTTLPRALQRASLAALVAAGAYDLLQSARVDAERSKLSSQYKQLTRGPEDDRAGAGLEASASSKQ